MSQKSWVPSSQPPAFYGVASRKVLLLFAGGDLAVGFAILHHYDEHYHWKYRLPAEVFSETFRQSPTHWMDLPEPPAAG